MKRRAAITTVFFLFAIMLTGHAGAAQARATFPPVKQVNAGLLNVGYVEMGPAGGAGQSGASSPGATGGAKPRKGRGKFGLAAGTRADRAGPERDDGKRAAAEATARLRTATMGADRFCAGRADWEDYRRGEGEMVIYRACFICSTAIQPSGVMPIISVATPRVW